MPDTRDSNSNPAGLAGKYFTFTLQSEIYGMDVRRVREIIRLTDITLVPRMPRYIKGVINLRGKIIPVMDLRLRFGFAEVKNTDRTCIIIVEVDPAPRRTSRIGLIVDEVGEVIHLSATDIQGTPDFGSNIRLDYVLGMSRSKGAVNTLLDINKVVAAGALEPIRTAPPSPASTQLEAKVYAQKNGL